MFAYKLVYKVVCYFTNILLLSMVMLKLLTLYFILILKLILKVTLSFYLLCKSFYFSDYVNYLNLEFIMIKLSFF